MGTISNVFGLLCLIALLGSWRIDCDLLDSRCSSIVHRGSSIVDGLLSIADSSSSVEFGLSVIKFRSLIKIPKGNSEQDRFSSLVYRPASNEQSTTTNKLLNIAKSQIGIREATGNNDGEAVERFLRYTGNKKGEPWCAAFVSWVIWAGRV